MTHDEYAAIGRRVKEDRWDESLRKVADDRTAMWELCERLMEKWQKRFPTMDRDALLESLGGTDD